MGENEKKGLPGALKTGLKLIVGVVLLALGARLIYLWRWDVLAVIKGCLGVVVILIGLILLAIAKE